jgi:hypothetical protein
MSWPASLLVAALAAVTGAVVAGVVASAAMGWYRVSSFEGQSAYAVVFLALLGMVGGVMVGLIVARLVAAGASPGMVRALVLSQAVTIGVILLMGGVARALADVPPRLGGRTLLLAVEVRWPAGQTPPEDETGEWRLRLSAARGGTVRASMTGPLWREDARQEDGRWVVPGAVEIFTGRGQRLLAVEPAELLELGFVLPLPGRPGRAHREWSDWLPRARAGGAPLQDGFRYRFRVVPTDQAIRSETYGPFEVATVATDFGLAGSGDGGTTWTASARFLVRHGGRPVVIEELRGAGAAPARHSHMDAVAALAGPSPALLVQVDGRHGGGSCYLLATDPAGATSSNATSSNATSSNATSDATSADAPLGATSAEAPLRVEPLGACATGIPALPLTSDPAVFARARQRPRLPGRFDRSSFADAEQYLFPAGMLDLRDRGIRRLADVDASYFDDVPPLDVAPDGRSFVRLVYGGEADEAALLVIGPDSGHYTVAIDPVAMRSSELEQFDPEWVRHYFAWERGDGGDRLIPRTAVTPLPYRGRLSVDSDGYREYGVTPAGPELRAALVDFLVAEFQALRMAAEPNAFAHEVRIADAPVYLSYREEDRRVGVWMDRGTNTQLVAAIAERFNAALRTRRYDALFVR